MSEFLSAAADTEEDTRLAQDQLLGAQAVRTLRAVLLVFFSAGIVILVYGLYAYGLRPNTVPGFFVAGLAALGRWLVHKGRIRQAIALVVWGTTAMVMVLCVFVAGVRTPALVLLPSLCMLAAWLLGVRTAVALFVFTTCGLVGFVVAEQYFGYVPPNVARTSLAVVLTIVPALAVALVIAAGAIRSFKMKLVQVTELTQNLEQRVAERTAELSKVVATLSAAQDGLVQSEKLASLGAMVAGISHELNTPIGNAVTVASTLQSHIRDFKQVLERGELKRSTLHEFVESSDEMADLMARAMARASELIVSFKQVAVDRSSERRREFDLKDLVDDIITSLRPTMRQRSVRITHDIAPGILCDTFPGPAGQVLSNLLQNAMKHAFEGRDSGHITIEAALDSTPSGAQVVMRIRDDGIGMSEHTRKHAFDPFFTTRMGQGGSGLGLSVSHTIATSVLAGALSVESAPGQGSCFTLRFLQHLPHAQDDAQRPGLGA